LLNVTFFNWDAIIYDLQNNNVITHDQYFENLSENILDINLKPSLDPLGNCVRAIRTIYRHHSKLTPTLVRYVNDVLESHSDTAIIFKEKQSHLSSQIQRSDLPILRHQIKQYLKEDVSENFLFHFNNQPELPFYQKTL